MATHSKRKKIWWTVGVVLVLIIGVRLALPYVILHYANKTLAEMDGYYGHIEDIDLAIIRGAYNIDSIYLNKVDTVSKKQTPFFAASEIDLSVEWKALFHGSIVGELVFNRARLRFTQNKVEIDQVRKDSTDFKQLLDDFMPLRVNRVEVNDSRIQFIDEFSKPPVNIQLTSLYATALNLRNSYDSAVLLPATLRAQAKAYDGEITLNVKLNPLANDPTFDMNAGIQDVNLVKLNEFMQAYARVDVNKGTLGLYTEVAAKEGRFEGYVKPLLKDVDVVGKEDKEDNLFRKVWEGLVGVTGQVFENQRKNQVATKIPFEGSLKNPRTDVWITIGNVLQNAFIRAIQPSIDEEINIASVDAPKKEEKKTFLQKIFGKKDGKKDEEKKKDKKRNDDAEGDARKQRKNKDNS